MRRWLSVCAIAFGALVAPAAQAQNTAAAQALFQQGRDLMAKGDYDAACKKLEDSQKLDPAPGTQLQFLVIGGQPFQDPSPPYLLQNASSGLGSAQRWAASLVASASLAFSFAGPGRPAGASGAFVPEVAVAWSGSSLVSDGSELGAPRGVVHRRGMPVSRRHQRQRALCQLCQVKVRISYPHGLGGRSRPGAAEHSIP